MNENCNITCEGYPGCSESTIYVYNKSITDIICTGYYSCQYTKIISSNVKLLTITADGYAALGNATIDIDNPNGHVDISCDSPYACARSDIIIWNAASINATFTKDDAFYWGLLAIYNVDDMVLAGCLFEDGLFLIYIINRFCYRIFTCFFIFNC